MSLSPVYILGGQQTDFAQKWGAEGLFPLLQTSVRGALEATQIEAQEIDVAHVGNFVAELFCGQGQLGGMFASIDPALANLPASRHEAACASGSMALLAAAAEIEAGRYDLACVTGVELMRHVSGQQAAHHLGAALWVGQEAQEAIFPWPYQFSQIADWYAERYGLRYEHLAYIARLNLSNARRNPNAQARTWQFTERSFALDDVENPVIEGRLRKQDCGRITDGAATVLLASDRYAREYAKKRGRDLTTIPLIKGWGHRTAPLRLADKFTLGQHSEYPLPHLRQTITDAYRRAGLNGPHDLDAIETHDCFTITEYIALDHFGLTPPGQSWQVIENGDIEQEGRLPVNPSGGLIGAGHPVGATGIRMLLDASKQVTGTAGAYQVEDAHTVATLNIGGSATTVACFIVSNR
ncbi:MAG: acetyl-CoA acetyltransferase [Chloroflexi bacterium]|nr:acetyl-CoA acetyltransferase [Chloroflexota bacterium]MBP8056074.1 acetyl-CoA acetyltransferase [Chloroflexota bacterium]